MTDKLKDIDPEIIAAIRDQVLKELEDKDVRDQEKQRIAKEEDKKAREAYIDRMKKSPDSWVEILGASEGGGKIKIELDWNNAFVKELRENGFVGEDDDAVVQHYIALLARDIAEDMAGGGLLFDEKEGE